MLKHKHRQDRPVQGMGQDKVFGFVATLDLMKRWAAGA